MSRIGKRKIPCPEGVAVTRTDDQLTVKGPKGELSGRIHPFLSIRIDPDGIQVEKNTPQRKADALSGMTRTLIANMVRGVTDGYRRELDIVGVGYRAELSGKSLVFQLGYTGWSGIPDSITTKGLSKSVNIYLMYDFPFKNNPKLSMAFGPGIGSDHILFTKTYVGIKDQTSTMAFKDQRDTNHFKKTKLAAIFLEAPIEFRYSANPETGKGLKMAFGVKVGTLINAHTRNSDFEDKNGNTINAIRTVLQAAASSQKKRVKLEVVS